MKNDVRVRGWWVLALLALALIAVPWPATWIEGFYSRGFYPRWQHVATRASNVSSLAVIDYLLIGLAIYLGWLVVRFIRGARQRSLLSASWELTRRVVRAAALIALIFLVSWGFNYRRRPLEETLRGGAHVSVTTEDIRALAERSISGTHGTRPVDNQVDRTYASVAARLVGPFERALRVLGMAKPTTVGRPKASIFLTPFYTKAGITGMVNPFALETIVHPGLLSFERPMVLAHEWAHLAGFADEADASAVAWLACTLGDPDLAYSAHLEVVLEAASALPRPVWKELRPKLDAGVVDDIAALEKRLKEQEPAVRDTAFKVYDQYLKSNGVSDGVKSYSRMLRVLVAMGPATRP